MAKDKKTGKLPGGWIKVKLGDMSQKLKAGGTPSRDIGEFWDGDIPFVLIDDITRANKYLFSTNKTISKKGLKNSSAWLVPENSILLSMYASLGEVVINKIEVATNQAILAIIPKKEVDLEFEYYLLKFNKKSFEKFITQTTQMNLNKEIISNVVFELPSSIVEQRKIAEILETVDNSIEKTDKIIEKYKRIKQGLMQVLLTRGIVESDELGAMSYELKNEKSDELRVRSYESEHKDDELGIKSYEFEGKRWEIRDEKKHKFKDSPLGKIPEEWEVVELGEVGNVKGGKRLPKGEDFAEIETPHPYIRLADIKELRVNLNSVKYLKKQTWSKIKRYNISRDDIMISIAGTVGLVALIPRELDGANLTENAAKITDIKRFNKQFLAYYLSSWKVQKQINSLLGVVAQPKLALFRIKQIKIPCPPLPEQRRIVSILSQIDKAIEKEEKYKEKLERIKQGLMEDLLTGKVRVEVD